MKRLLALVVLAAGLGCGDGTPPPGSDGGGNPGDPDAPLPVTRAIRSAPDLLVAADPKLDGWDGWPLAFDIVNAGDPGLRCRVTLEPAAGAPVTLEAPVDEQGDGCAVTWDGRGGDGAVLAPGTVELTALLLAAATDDELARATATLEVVRLGIAEVDLQGVGRATLMYGRMGGVSEGFYEIPADRPAWRLAPDATEPQAAVSLELADGSARPLPAPWADLESPPLDPASADGVEQDTYNLPTAWVAGELVELTATMSADVAGVPGGGAPTTAEVRVVAPEGTDIIGGDAAFAPGGQVTVRTQESPAPAVGRWDRSLRWTFEARAPGGVWVAVPGGVTTTHRLYGLAAQPIFDYPDVPHRAWVEIVDAVAIWVDGGTADPLAVAGRVVEGVYYELGLAYDVESGASFYTDYPGWGWGDAEFDLSAFVVRANGSVINCSDAASLVSTFANMMGVDLRYHILQRPDGEGFDLNYIRAIGMTEFDETPFSNGRGAFRYHAVVGPPDGTFYDATLALDGDGEPGAPPHTALLAEGLDPEVYLFDLSSEWTLIDVLMDEKVRVR